MEDAETEDNGADTESDDEFFGYEKIGDIRYIDRSFMDLGYIGYGDGIFLEKLDFGPNWQFEAWSVSNNLIHISSINNYSNNFNE